MRLFYVALAVSLAAGPVFGEQPPASSAGAAKSAAEDGRFDLPVSVERIREALERAPDKSMLDDFEHMQPDYRVEIEEWRRMREIIETLDFRTGPPPPGGLYGYEQQRLLNNPIRNPLGQPYAAFSGGELITLAIQSVAIKYLGGKALEAVSNAQRDRAERVAREQVTRAIMQYCAAQPDRATITICTRTIPPD
jgi:hypothetical protein